jgi:hypothetical protein
MSVAFAASTAGGNHEALARNFKITHELARGRIPYNRADRNMNHAVIAAPPVAITTHAMLPASRFVLFLVAQIEQGCKLGIGFHNHIAAAPAVAATGSSSRHELLAPKCDAAATAVSRNDANLGFIDELHDAVLKREIDRIREIHETVRRGLSGFRLPLIAVF